jgi:hypothetical protein
MGYDFHEILNLHFFLYLTWKIQLYHLILQLIGQLPVELMNLIHCFSNVLLNWQVTNSNDF